MIHFVLFALIGIAFWTDARKSILPNKLTIGGAAVGLLVHAATGGWGGALYSVAGAAAGFGMLLLLHLFGALGAGDVKLFAAIGSIMGVLFVMQCIVYSVLFAGVIGLTILIAKKQLTATGYKLAGWLIAITAYRDTAAAFGMKRQANITFPFMYAVVPGVITAWCYAFM